MAGLGWSDRSRWHGPGVFVAARVSAVVLSVVMLSACDLRMETDPIVYPSPDATTVARNSLADASAAVLEAATEAGGAADDVATGAGATAQSHLDALGGVYVTYPGVTPSPSPGVTPAPRPTLAEAIDSARLVAEDVAATSDDPDLVALARSMDLDWALRELWAARSAANEAEAAAAAEAEAAALASASPAPSISEPAPLPGDAGDAFFPLADGSTADAAGFAPGAATALAQDQLSALALAEDEARFAYETLAAQEFGPRRDDALTRSRLHAERSDALAALLDADPRTPLYQLRDANLLDSNARRELEKSLEIDLGARYAALLDGSSADDAAWLLNACFDAYARAMATDGFFASDLPTLPGLVVVEPLSASTAAPSSSPAVSPTP